MYIINTATAFLIISESILLAKKCVCSLLANTEIIVPARTASVVIFMPPAVDPGAPPVSMSMIITATPSSLSDVRSTVLNPAVLVVTD